MTATRGYTLIELLIVVTIMGILVTFGVSAYGKAQQNQIAATNSQKLLATLESAENQANTGQKDCSGGFAGVNVTTIVGSSSLSTKTICSGGQHGATTTITLTNAKFNNAYNLTFEPLAGGVNVGNSTSTNIDYTGSDGTIYQITVTNTGTITYTGIIP